MTLVDLDVRAPSSPVGARRERRAGRDERHRLAEVDRAAARLAELHEIRDIVCRAQDVVRSGWVRHGWFRRTSVAAGPAPGGTVTSDPTVTGACLVGAIVHAGGGMTSARSQPVQRALDLAWHVLHGDPRQPVRWCPAPPVRAAHLRDLTGWNDHQARTARDVVDLLAATARATTAEIDRLRGDAARPALV